MVGVIAPGKFEDLFFFLATENVTYASKSPYSPTVVADSTNSGSSAEIITQLESFDVHAQLNFTVTRDLVNGTSPSSAIWHDGHNSIPSQAGSPYFVAANWGPTYINNETGSWQIVQPFVTPATGEHNFTQGTITLSRQTTNVSIPTWKLTDHTAIQVLEGSLALFIGNESATLISGDIAFIPGGISFQYNSMAAFTKFLYVAAGDQGLDQQLLATARPWDYPVFPTYSA